jgi:transposase InsO family protein
MGLGYRWSLDFAGLLPLTVRHDRYVLVMVEHFSKWIELVPSPDKSSEGVVYAFLDRVLSHFGAPTEVLIDQGTKFQGEFQVLCDKALIDHRTMFRDHPEADGVAERVVKTVKKALHKYGLHKGHLGDWDIQSPWLAMGYRFSCQASLVSFSPYFLLYGRDPDLPTTIRHEFSEVVNLDDAEMWLRVCS